MQPSFNEADLRRAADWIYEAAASWPRAKDYVLALLFLRYLSEWHRETLTAQQRKYKGDQVRLSRAMSRELFLIPDNCTFEKVMAQSTEPALGRKINAVLGSIAQANPHKLRGVFSSADFNSAELGDASTSNARISRLLEAITAYPPGGQFRPSDWVGALADTLIIKFAEEAARRREAYFTPMELCELMTQLVSPMAGERIYDPACGSGGLLIQSARGIPDGNFSLFGNEHHQSTWALCRMNLMLKNLDATRIFHGDPVRAPICRSDDALRQFDVIVSDPPFSMEWDPASIQHDRFNRFKRGLPPKNSSDYTFISHIVESMDPATGRACVVMPLGVLFRGGSEGLIRRSLLEEGIVEGVVRLPSSLFYGTSISTVLLMLRASRAERSVFFIDASRDFGNDHNRSRLRDKDIQRILGTFRARAEERQYARLVSYEEIERNDFNLNIPRYIKKLDEDSTDLERLQREITRLDRELMQARTELSAAVHRLEP